MSFKPNQTNQTTTGLILLKHTAVKHYDKRALYENHKYILINYSNCLLLCFLVCFIPTTGYIGIILSRPSVRPSRYNSISSK